MARPATSEANVIWIDTETSGLSPIDNEIIEVAFILTDTSGRNILKEYVTKVIPTKPVEKQAAEINGYTPEAWTDAVSLDYAMKMVLSYSNNAMFAGHNAAFDWGFIEAALKKNQQKWNGFYHKIDTVSLALPLLLRGLVPNVKLATLTKFFNIPHEDAHTALSDIRATRELYLKLSTLWDMSKVERLRK